LALTVSVKVKLAPVTGLEAVLVMALVVPSAVTGTDEVLPEEGRKLASPT